MTGSSSNNPIFSGLTLALLEDSGWYAVNHSAASPLVWGRAQGCNFVNKPCTDWDQKVGYVGKRGGEGERGEGGWRTVGGMPSITLLRAHSCGKGARVQFCKQTMHRLGSEDGGGSVRVSAGVGWVRVGGVSGGVSNE